MKDDRQESERQQERVRMKDKKKSERRQQRVTVKDDKKGIEWKTTGKRAKDSRKELE